MYHVITIRLKSGDKIEVKWTINDEEDEESPPPEAAAALQAPQDAKGVTVWWAAEIQCKTDNVHTLSDEERQEGAAVQSSDIKVPIYRLSYAPMEGVCCVYIYCHLQYFFCTKLNMFCCISSFQRTWI